MSRKFDPLSVILSEYCGYEIFSEENHYRLNKALNALDDSYGLTKDLLLISNMKHIPQKLYAVMNASQNVKQQAINECKDILCALTLDPKVCEKIISYYTATLKINASIEEKIKVEPQIGTYQYAKHFLSFYNAKQDYRTCQIGDKIWFAENLNEENFYNGRTVYNKIGRPAENKKYGCLYRRDDASICVPPGWRLPTVEDYRDLIVYIGSLGYDAGTVLKSQDQWGGQADPGLDLFGFCAYPTARNSETNELQTWFWTSSETNDKDYPYYCAGLKADSNEISISSAGSGYYACIRYVKDVEENKDETN